MKLSLDKAWSTRSSALATGRTNDRAPEGPQRFEDLVKQHGYVKARQLILRTTIQQHQKDIEKKQDSIHESYRPQRVKTSIILSSTSGKASEDSMLEKILQANRGITALELMSGDLMEASKSLMQSGASKELLEMAKKHESSLPQQHFLEDDDVRFSLQSAQQKLLIPNKGYKALPPGLGETLLLQTSYVKELHCARNHLRSLLSPEMPQLSTYHLRYVRVADFSYNSLVRLPDAIGHLQLLEMLNLSHNQLSRVPASFLTLRQLHTLNLEGNSFDRLPEELGTLDSLTSLDLSQNLFQTFPYPVTKLRSLRSLKLSQNLLTHMAILPPLLKNEDMWISTIDRRTGEGMYMNILTKERLRHIETYDGVGVQKAEDLHVFQPPGTKSYRRRKLWLSVCQIHEWEPVTDSMSGGTYYCNNVSGETSQVMPKSLDTLGIMQSLTHLVVSRNSVGSLPDSFLQLRNLKSLVFTQNRLRELPEGLGCLQGLEHLELASNELKLLPVSICDCSSLKMLLLSDNHLMRLPERMGSMASLVMLDVSANRLKQLPSSLGFCASLSNISAAENPLEDPPVGEFSKGMDHVKWYLRNRFHIQQRGMPPEMQYHTIGIANEITLLKPELLETVSQRVLAAKKDGILNLQLLGLIDIPVSVLRMAGLKKLKLDFNKELQFKNGFPEDLRRLQSLSLRGCGLSSLPENIYIFDKLTVLNLEENRMEYLPTSICEVTTLTTLDLSKNRLYSLPEDLHMLRELKSLVLESNNLEVLPASLASLSELRMLNLAKNRLIDVPEEVCALPNLHVLNLEKNFLYALPSGLADMQLLELRVGHNRIERLDADMFTSRLGRNLHMFSCCENNLLELPASLVNLSQQALLEADYNPLISPPSALLPEGLRTVQHYLAIREKRKKMLVELLEDEDFEVNSEAFVPRAAEVLEDGTGFLSPEDLAEFDVAVHEFLNGEYYLCPATAEEMVASIAKLREDRETELYLTIIRTFLKVLEKLYDEEDELFFNKATLFMVQRPWGRDGEMCNCYAVSLTALLRETSSIDAYPSGRPSIFSLVAAALPHISFPFTIELLKDSIRLYVSPYGIIADTEQVLFPACDCVDANNHNRPKRHDACTKAAVVITKRVYVEEEADRREREEDEFMERFEEIDFNVRIWLLTEEGQKAMNQEVRTRKNVLREEISLREEMLLSLQFKSRKAKDVLTDLLNRRDLFEAGQAYEHHGFTDVQEAIKKINKAEDDVKILAERMDILAEMLKKLKLDLSQDYHTFCYQAASDLVQKYCVLGYEAAVMAFRRFAAQNNLNRHWDGEDGSAFLDWMSKHTILPTSGGMSSRQGSEAGSRPNSAAGSRPNSAAGGMERSHSAMSVHSTSSAETSGTAASGKVSVKNTALETEFHWKDTNNMEKFSLKLYNRYRNANPFQLGSM